MGRYTVEYAEQWGIGGGINGTGKRQRVYGYFVVNPQGLRCRVFKARKAEVPSAKKQAEDWCDELNRRIGVMTDSEVFDAMCDHIGAK